MCCNVFVLKGIFLFKPLVLCVVIIVFALQDSFRIIWIRTFDMLNIKHLIPYVHVSGDEELNSRANFLQP